MDEMRIDEKEMEKQDNTDFEVNAETGELVGISFWKYREHPEQISAEACEAVARELVGQFADVSRYTLETEETELTFIFTYTYCIDGIKTNDSYRVAVSKDGEIASFYCYGGGSFSGEKLTVPQEDFEAQLALLLSEGEKAVEEKIGRIYEDFHEVYPDPKASYEYTMEPEWQKLVILPDNTLGMYYQANVTVRIPLEDRYTRSFGSVLQFVVKCQPSDLPMPQSGAVQLAETVIPEGASDGVRMSARRLNLLHASFGEQYPSEYSDWNAELYYYGYNDSAAEKRSAYLDGSSYYGNYQESLFLREQERQIDCYSLFEMDLAFDGDTEVPVSMQINFLESGTAAAEKIRAKADAVAGEVGDLSQWSVREGQAGGCHRFLYYRWLPEERKLEWMLVHVTTAATLNSFFRGELVLPEENTEQYINSALALLSEEAHRLFAQKRNEIYDILVDGIRKDRQAMNYANEPVAEAADFQCQCVIDSMYMTVLPDDTLGLAYITRMRISDNYRQIEPRYVGILVKCENAP